MAGEHFADLALHFFLSGRVFQLGELPPQLRQRHALENGDDDADVRLRPVGVFLDDLHSFLPVAGVEVVEAEAGDAQGPAVLPQAQPAPGADPADQVIGHPRLAQAEFLPRGNGEQQLVVLAAGQDQFALGKSVPPARPPEAAGTPAALVVDLGADSRGAQQAREVEQQAVGDVDHGAGVAGQAQALFALGLRVLVTADEGRARFARPAAASAPGPTRRSGR